MTGNGVAPMVFSAEEYADRLSRVRELMDRQGLSALLVTDPANIFYLTGYNAWSFYTPQVLFVPYRGEMVFYLREMDANGAHRTAWLDRENIVGYPEQYVHRPHIHPFDWVAYAFRLRGLIAPSRGLVGLEMDSHFFSPKAYRALVNAIPEWTLVDAFELVNWVRSVKSPAELALMRRAALVTEATMKAARDAIRSGVRQCDVASAIAAVQAGGTPEVGGDYTSVVPLLPTGESADTPHLTWNEERLRPHEAVVVELAGAYHRYHVPMARTFMPDGGGSDEVRRLADITDQGLQVVLDTIGPGVPVHELALRWNFSLAAHGLEKPSRLGYSIGVGFPPDWGERTISIRAEEQTVLEEDMTFHLICGMWMDGYGYEVSEPIRVSSDGVETLTSFPRGLVDVGDGVDDVTAFPPVAAGAPASVETAGAQTASAGTTA